MIFRNLTMSKTKHKIHYWVTADGRKLRVKDMETDHLYSAIRWCQSQVVRLRYVDGDEDEGDKEWVDYKDVPTALSSINWVDPRMKKHNTGDTYEAMKWELQKRLRAQ